MQVSFKDFNRFAKMRAERRLSFSDRFPFLKTRVTSAIFIQEGNLDKLITLFISVERIFECERSSNINEYERSS